ncbi:undecaprenyl-diphosphate phosphatase [Candidatus Saccharibacteria bacterium]|nr:undecaprenyl-diphosphate phosphatase [Candidatus Saccharibacteria bacterium]
MELLQALLLGIIEGLTEFLPISSTGHLIIAEEYIAFKDTAKVFTVVIQLGAIAAVAWYYRNDLAQRIAGLFGGQRRHINFWLNLFFATLPAGLLGLALANQFENYATPTVVAVALILGGIVLWLVDRAPTTEKPEAIKLDDISRTQALSVGLVQCMALIPGVSRSGASIVGGLLTGLNRTTATAFSFYLGIPVLGLASIYKLTTDWDKVGQISGGLPGIAVGAIAAFVTALFAVSWLLRYITTHNFRPFAYYRILLGIVVLLLLA